MSPRITKFAEELLRRSHSNLARSRQLKSEEVYFEDLCFDARQAAKKSIKAVFVLHGHRFSLTLDLGELLESLEVFLPETPENVPVSVELNDYTEFTRHPHWGEKVSEEDYVRACRLAQSVVDFADDHFAQVKGQLVPRKAL